MRLAIFLWLSASLALVASETGLTISLTPPDNQFVALESRMELRCKSTLPIGTCSWTTPYASVFVLGQNQVAEGGRLARGNGTDHECAIVVNGVEQQDVGVWKCHVNIEQDREVLQASGQATVTLATPPKVVSFDFVSTSSNGSSVVYEEDFINVPSQKVTALTCKALNASMPQPAFEWFVGEEQLKEDIHTVESDFVEVGSNLFDFAQTLHYAPSSAHANRTLRCVVAHAAAEDNLETAIVLRLTEDDSDVPDFLVTEDQVDQEDVPMNNLAVIVGIVVGVIVILVAIILISLKVKNRSLQAETKTGESSADAEAPEEAKSNEERDGTSRTESMEQVEGQEVATQEKEAETSKSKLGDRFASFFRLKKRAEKPAEVDNAQAEPENEEKTEETAIEMPSEESGEEKTDSGEVVSNSRLAAFLAFFKPNSQASKKNKMEDVVLEYRKEPAEEEDCEEKAVKDATETEKVEYEPEEKEAKTTEATREPSSTSTNVK